MNSLLILHPVLDGMAIPYHDFSVCPFWVQIHGLPIGKMNRSNAEIIGRRFQKLLAIETNPYGIMLDRSFLRVRVEINLNLPLPQGHDNRSCRLAPRNNSFDSGYDPNIRASTVQRSHIPIEVIRQEVDEEEKRVTELLGRRAAVRNHNGGARDPNPSGAREDTSISTQIPMEIVGVRLVALHTLGDVVVKDSHAPPPYDAKKSKLLCLCGPDPNPALSNPISKSPAKRVPKPNPSRIRKNPRMEGLSSTTVSLEESNSCLFDVPMQMLDFEPSLVPGNLATELKWNGRALGDIVLKNHPSIVFLMETKNNKVFLETIRRSLGFDSSNYIDPIGLFGGLALWWKNEVEINIETSIKNIVHTVISEKSTSHDWAGSFIYGSPNREGRDQAWEELTHIGRFESLPWLCIGDFNEVLSTSDKMGGSILSPRRLSSFHEMLTTCGLVDLGFKGPRFTWRNNRLGGDLIMERLYMAFANDKWRELYDQATVFVEAAIGSDHNLLILNTSFPLKKVRKPFRFKSFWTTEESCKLIICESWDAIYEGSGLAKVCKKLKGCKEKLKKIIKSKLEDLWQKDAMYWHQRSRIKWLQMGDKNSRFFHLSTIHGRQRNQLVKLKDETGIWKMEEIDISGIIRTHFQGLYSPPPLRDFGDILSLITPLVTPNINASLIKPISNEEIRLATFQMRPLKALVLTGFLAYFFKSIGIVWEVTSLRL
ncbi:hypothetical protein RHSIM_Rhsim01G0274800 [Rhododendron simsii]|uniref:Endonuclease/exonuclease/phosphatase domain-containing protein n=1 Tax=Rhododendron simsii TaxID=118357 RepID=A0A834HJ73_RHOSS|nr:hypothetical protein RHSIM_Rhsim01G0274800 [Rhododendron simsii]